MDERAAKTCTGYSSVAQTYADLFATPGGRHPSSLLDPLGYDLELLLELVALIDKGGTAATVIGVLNAATSGPKRTSRHT